MKQVRVIIERGNDGNFSCFVSDETPLKNGILGYGNTVQEAKDDFISAYNEAIKMLGDIFLKNLFLKCFWWALRNKEI